MILVTGGTGTVGSRIVKGLVENQQPVRVFARGHSEWSNNPMPQLRKMGVDVITGDIRNEQRLADALQGCTAVVHCASVMLESKDDSLQSINVDATLSLLKLAEAAGVQRFIFLSCLGCSAYSVSKYLRTKYEAEAAVRATNFYWTIFRPSLIFEQDAPFVRALEFWTNKGPFVWVVGSGLNEVQPVSADDVAACVVQSIYNRDTVHKSYDLAGPRVYNLTELMQMAARFNTGIDKPAFKIPSPLGFTIAKFMRQLNARAPISEDVMRVLTTDYTADAAIMRDNFKVNSIPLESFYRVLGKDDDGEEDEEDEDDHHEDEEYEDEEDEEEQDPRRRRNRK